MTIGVLISLLSQIISQSMPGICDTKTDSSDGCPTLWENFLAHYGWPEKILTDQGKSFENKLIQELCELAQVKKLCTSPYHPETNGQCEHFNATLISMLGTLPTHAKRNWQEWVTTLTHAYNCTVSSVTGFSPYFLMFGRTPKIPLDIEMGVTLIHQEPTSYQNYAKNYKPD